VPNIKRLLLAKNGIVADRLLPEEALTMRAATEDFALIVARAMRERLGATWRNCETGAGGLRETATATHQDTRAPPWSVH
jgi:hypothetical protein